MLKQSDAERLSALISTIKFNPTPDNSIRRHTLKLAHSDVRLLNRILTREQAREGEKK